MSCFKGRIKELENILVDYFFSDNSVTCFFLSHCHTDHMQGLTNLLSTTHDNNSYFLYCSPLSRLILLNKYSKYKNVIKELTTSTTITVPESKVSPSYEMTVTPIPAGHCPGSVMFLFETVNKTILYTGDFRIMKGDIKKFKQLHNLNVVKTIDKIYFDATFLSENYWTFPSRLEAVTKLIHLIKTWLAKNSASKVLLVTSAAFGYEHVFTEVARLLNYKIHVKDWFYELFWNVPEVGCFLTKDHNSTKIFAIPKNDEKFLDFSKSDDLLIVKLSAQWYRTTSKSITKPLSKELSQKKVLICYSTHCSCSELIDFLTYLHPSEVEACTSTVCASDQFKEKCLQKLFSGSPLETKKDPQLVNVNSLLLRKKKVKLKFVNCRKKKFEDLIEYS